MKKKPAPKPKEISPVSLTNHWMIEFGPAMAVDSFLVHRISPLVYEPKNKWKPVQIDFVEAVDKHVFMNLVTGSRKPHEPIVIHYVHSNGDRSRHITFQQYEILEVSQDGLDYGLNDVLMSHLLIQATEII